DQFAKTDDRLHVERVPQRQRFESDAVLARLRREDRIGTADDRDVVAALAQARRGLKHLVHRAGVELVELEDLKYAHARRAHFTVFLIALLLAGCMTDRTRRRFFENVASTYDLPAARAVLIVPVFGVTRIYHPI